MVTQAYGPVLLALVAAVVLVLVLVRRRAARLKNRKEIPVPRVEGFLVNSPLHPRMTRACVFDLGTSYGRGFRRKEGPALPHGPDCQCRATPFSVPGTEAFSGSLRRVGDLRCAVPGFPAEACEPLFDALRRVNADPVPHDLGAYLAQAGLEDFTPEQRGPVRKFLEERYRFLKALPGGEANPTGPKQPAGAV